MTKNQAQNTIIARYLGRVECDKWTTFIAGASMIKGECSHENCYPKGMCPNYSEDLNAMHEAEKHLPETSEFAYIANLTSVVSREEGFVPICKSTAAQRAEAFCMTIQSHGQSTPDQEA